MSAVLSTNCTMFKFDQAVLGIIFWKLKLKKDPRLTLEGVCSVQKQRDPSA